MFSLALILWLLVLLLKPRNWTYRNVLVFVLSMVTAPVLLILYGWLVFRTRRPARNPALPEDEG